MKQFGSYPHYQLFILPQKIAEHARNGLHQNPMFQAVSEAQFLPVVDMFPGSSGGANQYRFQQTGARQLLHRSGLCRLGGRVGPMGPGVALGLWYMMIWGYENGETNMEKHMGMDQYLLIPFLGGWTSINPSYCDVNYRGTIGFDPLPGAWSWWLQCRKRRRKRQGHWQKPPTSLLKMAIDSWFMLIYLLKMVIFHSYVSLPEGRS